MSTLWNCIWPGLSVLAVVVVILLEDLYERP